MAWRESAQSAGLEYQQIQRTSQQFNRNRRRSFHCVEVLLSYCVESLQKVERSRRQGSRLRRLPSTPALSNPLPAATAFRERWTFKTGYRRHPWRSRWRVSLRRLSDRGHDWPSPRRPGTNDCTSTPGIRAMAESTWLVARFCWPPVCAASGAARPSATSESLQHRHAVRPPSSPIPVAPPISAPIRVSFIRQQPRAASAYSASSCLSGAL